MFTFALKPAPRLTRARPSVRPVSSDNRPNEFRWIGARALFVVGSRSQAQASEGRAARCAAWLRSRRAVPLVLHTPSDSAEQQADRAASFQPDLIVAVGDDGAANAGARAALALDRPLLIVPSGRTNLIARDLGISPYFHSGSWGRAPFVERRIDAAAVNGRCFLHSAVLGLIPSLERRRDRLRRQTGGARIVEACRLASGVLRGSPIRLRVGADNAEYEGATMSVVVSCNPLSVRSRGRFSRPSIDGGRLGVYFSAHHGRLATLRLLFSHLAGSVARDPCFRPVITRSLSVTSREGPISATVDGQLVRLTSPLRFSVSQHALRVLVPALGAKE